jgi:hypothetical protein
MAKIWVREITPCCRVAIRARIRPGGTDPVAIYDWIRATAIIQPTVPRECARIYA